MDSISLGAMLILATQGVTLIGALVGLYMTFRNHKALNEVSIRVDGRLDQLIALTGVASKAEGKAEEAAEQKDREAKL